MANLPDFMLPTPPDERGEFYESNMRSLERNLAYENVTCFIEGETFTVADPDGGDGEWIDLSTFSNEIAGLDELFADALAYLEWRGLLQRNERHPNLIQILNEDEPLPTPTSQVETTERGFGIYARLSDTYANEVVVQQSSSVAPCVWIFAKPTKTLSGEAESTAPHLSIEQAEQVAMALLHWARDARRAGAQ